MRRARDKEDEYDGDEEEAEEEDWQKKKDCEKIWG